MKDLDISISEKGKEDLKAIIGQENISFVYRREMTENEAYYKVQIKTDKGNYLLKNSLDWFDNCFAGGDWLPHFDIEALSDDVNPFENSKESKLIVITLDEKVVDTLLLRDTANVFKGDKRWQNIDSSEGIIFVTERRQLGFFKDTMWLDSTINIYEGKNVVEMAEGLKKHFDIFGWPFHAKCERFLVSLNDGSETKLETEEEIGERIEGE